MSDEIKFAGTIIEIENQVVAKITSFNRSLSIDEEDITGAEDILPGTDILHKDFAAVAIGETASVAGVAISGDLGQSELAEAAESGAVVVMRHTRPDGTGYAMTGFFSSYEETGSTTAVYRFSGTFRIKSKTAIAGS